MSDKTAAELVADYAKTIKELKRQDNPATEYSHQLSLTIESIKEEMEEWYDERQQQIKER